MSRNGKKLICCKNCGHFNVLYIDGTILCEKCGTPMKYQRKEINDKEIPLQEKNYSDAHFTDDLLYFNDADIKDSFLVKKYIILDQENTKSLVEKLRVEMKMTNKSISEYIHVRIEDVMYKSSRTKSISEESFNLLKQLASEVNFELKEKGIKKKKIYSIIDMQELARDVGLEKTGVEGKCLSEKYINMITKLEWKCGLCQNEFLKAPEKLILRRSWCPRCANSPNYLHQQITIENMQELARKVGLEKTGVEGKCLSEKFINMVTKLEWKCGVCQSGFFKTPKNVKLKRSWCPSCSQGYYEKICRGFMERIFSYIHNKEIKFKTVRLEKIIKFFAGIDRLNYYRNLAKNIKINGVTNELHIDRMHVDGFNFELGMGFERNGRQHYERIKRFQPTIDDFYRQLEIDKFKILVFNDLNLPLIIVGFDVCNRVFSRIEPEEMQDYIISQLPKELQNYLTNIPTFNHKTFFEEDFVILTSIQQRLLSEFKEKQLFVSTLLNMFHLDDISEGVIYRTIRNFWLRGFLNRRRVFNPKATGIMQNQYRYSLSELGNKLLESY